MPSLYLSLSLSLARASVLKRMNKLKGLQIGWLLYWALNEPDPDRRPKNVLIVYLIFKEIISVYKQLNIH